MFREFRFAARALARWRGGLVIALLTLAVGIGATTSLYALVRVLTADLPGVPDVGRIGRIYAVSQSLHVDRAPIATQEFEAQLAHAASFESVGAYAQADITIGTGTQQRTVTVGYASPAFFQALAVPPAAGRIFSKDDAAAGTPVAVLSAALAERVFPDGMQASRAVTLNGIAYTVSGVMPRGFSYAFIGVDADVWLPMTHASRDVPGIVSVFARLRPGVTWADANAELSRYMVNGGSWRWHAIPVQEDMRRRTSTVYGLTLGPAFVILLISCLNVACMLLARGIGRERELAVRRSLGASRLRIVRDVLCEHLLLASVAALLGAALASALLHVVRAALAALQPALALRLLTEGSVLPIALGAGVLASGLFGALPALRVARRDPASALSGGACAERMQIRGYGARDLVVFFEVGTAVGLVVFAAMVLHLFSALQHVRFAFPADRVVAMRVPAAASADIAQRVREIPGVASVTTSSGMLGGAGSAMRIRAADGHDLLVSRLPVGDGFFPTLQLQIMRGRAFDAAEVRGRAAVAVVSESAARALSSDGQVLGLQLPLLHHGGATATVIGVCRDAIDYGELADSGLSTPDVYVPYDPSEVGDVAVLARVMSEPHRFLEPLKSAARVPAGTRQPVPDVLADEARFHDPGATVVVVRVIAGFALVALLLAASGIIAVVGQSVEMRTREFGIRLALGSTRQEVLRLVLAREARLVAAALVSGAGMTYLLTRVMFVELARLSVTALSVWVALIGLCGGIATLATIGATWRIVRLQPAVVLRKE